MKKLKVAIVGQPNVGKSMLINSIGNSHLKVGNFSGVTVEKAEVSFDFHNHSIRIIDLPGTYSLNDYTQDERVTKEFLENEDYDMIINVVDATNLERNLFLTTQLLGLNKKMIVVLNLIDEAEKQGINIDEKQLSSLLGVPVIKTSASQKRGIKDLLNQIVNIENIKFENKIIYSDAIEEEILNIKNFLDKRGFKDEVLTNREIAIKLLQNSKEVISRISKDIIWVELSAILKNSFEHIFIHFDEKSIETIFSEERVSISTGLVQEVITFETPKKKKCLTKKIDDILLHKFFGIPIFLILMWGLFQLTFEIGSIPMEWIDNGISSFGDLVGNYIQSPFWNSLIVDGIISGVGAVLLFLPNILILFLGIALLETTGYMSRVAFLLDGFFHKFGLHGKSFIPLVTGFGCSIPAYMAARTLKSEKDRLITMFIIGFMSCGARLPIYVLFVSAFFPHEEAVNYLFGIYILGAIFGLIGAKLLRMFVFKGKDEPFVMELPTYRFPSIYLLWHTVKIQALMYLKKAGTFILVVSMFIWFLSNFPQLEKPENMSNIEFQKYQLENSYLGMVGKISQPVFEPLGFNWQLTIALETGLAAKEVVVATLGVLYSLGDEVDENSESLIKQLRKNIPFETAVAFIIFVKIYLPCFAASIVFIKETGKKIYFVYLFIFTTISAYLLSFIARGLILLF